MNELRTLPRNQINELAVASFPSNAKRTYGRVRIERTAPAAPLFAPSRPPRQRSGTRPPARYPFVAA